MKNSIIAIAVVLSASASAQVSFQGEPAAVKELNSERGQNYLVLHPYHDMLAFTEESTNSEEYYNQKDTIIDNISLDYVVFYDDLLEKGMISPLGFTSDEGLYYSIVIRDKGTYRGSIHWLNPKKKTDELISIPFFRNRSDQQSGCISSDSRYMIISMESNNSYGVEDLYLSRKQPDGSWGAFRNLGATLNTEFQEITPFLAEDNKTLFFATNGREGEGSYDLFYSVRQDESWRNWSEPVNLGKRINTSGAETSFSYRDGEPHAYFISSKNSDGYGDIMRISFSEDIEKDTLQESAPSLSEVVAEQVMLKIMDKRTKELIAAELLFDSLTTYVPAGVFVLDSIYLKTQSMEVKSPGYLPRLIPIGDDLKLGVNDILLERIEVGETIQLPNVLFHRGTPELLSGSEQELDLVVEMLNDNPTISILLKGHTDNTGDPVKNVKLSEERVKTVKAYILSKGISAYRVRGKGYGGNQPIASNDTEESRRLNRRVEFEVIED